MYERIDIQSDDKIHGYSFVDEDAMEFYVTTPYKQGAYTGKFTVDIGIENEGSVFTIYKHDIPKLIKALEAAYNHKEG